MRSRANAQVNFQRRHFEFIARTIASFATDSERRDNLAHHFARHLRLTNPNFQADKFIQWANGDERSESEIRAAEKAAEKERKRVEKARKAALDSLIKPLVDIEKAKALVEKLGGRQWLNSQ